ncbi:MAG: 5-(carboxyamino)imidazole ribonucleotide synthase [bacterium]
MQVEEKFPLPPGATIGILGGGQLGRMLASAAHKLGFKTHIFCPEEKCPAADNASHCTHAAYDDETALKEFLTAVDVVTFEFENIPLSAVEFIEATDRPLFPNAQILGISQDRLAEKRFLKDLEIATAAFMPVASEAALGMACEVTGLPAILKTRRFGYDGKGQSIIHDTDDIAKAYEDMAGASAIMEGFVAFDCEISVILVRALSGDIQYYPPARNIHQDGILRSSFVPAGLPADIESDAVKIAIKIAEESQYVGVLAVEFFVEKSGHLRVNEIAPRVHNSGHWTQEACIVSQFENHIRAITGWPLGDTKTHRPCEMENLIGDDVLRWPERAAESQCAITLYGKKQPRPGRKMGHITRLK